MRWAVTPNAICARKTQCNESNSLFLCALSHLCHPSRRRRSLAAPSPRSRLNAKTGGDLLDPSLCKAIHEETHDEHIEPAAIQHATICNDVALETIEGN